MKKESIFKLMPNEANALYGANINNECPMKYHTDERKVWWTSDFFNLPYTLCQNCYHVGNYGEKDVSIKNSLVPVLTSNLDCNCDGVKNEIGYPQQLSENWRIGIYLTSPSISLLDTHIYNENSTNFKLTAWTNYNICKYAICLYGPIPNVTHGNPIIYYEIMNKTSSTKLTASFWDFSDDGNCYMTIDKIMNEKSIKYLTFIKPFDKININETNEIIINVFIGDRNEFLTSSLTNSTLLFNIELNICYINDINKEIMEICL